VTGIAQVFADSALALVQRRRGHVAGSRGVLVAASLGACLVFANGSVLPVALVAVGRDLSLSPQQLQWLVNADILPLAALTMAAGALGDRFGQRRMFLLGVLAFGLAGLLSAVAPNWSILMTGRLLQGVGAAFILPNSLSILGQSEPSGAKASAVGVWSAAAAVAAALAPALAGLVLVDGSWRAALSIPVPLAVMTLLVVALWAPPDAPNRETPIDLAGAALSTLALTALGAGLTRLSSGPSDIAFGLALVVLAILVVAVLLVVERRRGNQAMLPTRLLGARTMIGANLFTILLYAPFTAVLTLIPFVMLRVTALPTTVAGLAFAPLQILITAVSPLAGLLCRRVGRRPPLILGGLLASVGCLAALRINGDARYWADIFPAIALISLGVSLALAPLTTLILTSVERSRAGAVSGVNSAVSRAGSLIAVALLGGVLRASGPSLVTAFHAAMIVAALSAGLAALCALIIEPGAHVDFVPTD
jgi:MFS family permease